MSTALKTLYCRHMNKLNNIASDIRGFCISNPEADFDMVMDFVDSQICPFEADDDLCDLVLKIMLDVEESNQST
jgi:hypothetical protein